MAAGSTIEIEVAGHRLGGRTVEPDGAARAAVVTAAFSETCAVTR
jgi:hypothetical protein